MSASSRFGAEGDPVEADWRIRGRYSARSEDTDAGSFLVGRTKDTTFAVHRENKSLAAGRAIARRKLKDEGFSSGFYEAPEMNDPFVVLVESACLEGTPDVFPFVLEPRLARCPDFMPAF